MIVTDDGLRITVSVHAANAALRRIPDLEGRKFQDAIYWGENMALEALRANRKARTCPRFCVRTWANGFAHRKKERVGTTRYAWDDAETFVLLLNRLQEGRNGEPDAWLVVTVMAPEAKI